jgi:glycosyltransferase involved in cell wall biosynthesis
LRIFYDHQVFSLQNVGGVSRYYFELLRQFASQEGVQQELFLGLHQTELPFQALASDSLRVVGCQSSLDPGGRRYVANEALGNAYVVTRGKFDIYHATHHRYMPLVRARKMVITHCDCTHEKFPAEFRYLDRVLLAKRALFARADAIICISESSRQDLLNFYNVDSAKTRVIHLGLTRLSRSPHDSDEIKRRVRRDYVLYVGSRAIYKNFRGFLQAFRDTQLHEDFDLLVLGGGPFSAPELELVSDLGMAQSVVTFSRVTDGLLAEAYAGAKLLAYPSLSEGFGLPPLEAMSLGCPVLACHSSSVPEICGEVPFYFAPGSPDSLRDALLQAVRDEAARARAVERGRVVASLYSWERCAEQTLALYRE